MQVLTSSYKDLDIGLLNKLIKELEARLEIPVGEAMQNGFTRSISKFYVGREKSIVSCHQVILDPSGEKPPHIGPDPIRNEKLTRM